MTMAVEGRKVSKTSHSKAGSEMKKASVSI